MRGVNGGYICFRNLHAKQVSLHKAVSIRRFSNFAMGLSWVDRVLALWHTPPKFGAEEVLAYRCGLIDGEKGDFWPHYVSNLDRLEDAYGDDYIILFGTPALKAWTVGHIMFTVAKALDGGVMSEDEFGDFYCFCLTTCLLADINQSKPLDRTDEELHTSYTYWDKAMPLQFVETNPDGGFGELTLLQRSLVRTVLQEAERATGLDPIFKDVREALNSFWDAFGTPPVGATDELRS